MGSNHAVPELEALRVAKTKDDISKALEIAAKRLGFVTWSTIFVTDTPEGPSFYTLENNPPGYDDIYHDPYICKTNPVMQTLKVSNLPVVWDHKFYQDRSHAELYEVQASYGMKFGITAALHLPGGKHCVVGFDGPHADALAPNLLPSSLGHLQLLLVHTEAALRPLALPDGEDAGDYEPLTPRERECLVWTAAGKTAWEIGRILKLSEATVTKYLDQVSKKLRCVNKAQAVAKAMRLGLIA